MKFRIFFAFILLVSLLTAQKEEGEAASKYIIIKTDTSSKVWDYGGNIGLFASQVVFINWAAGGTSSYSGIINGELFVNYSKNRHSWDNVFKGEFGMIKSQNEPISKNKDFFELSSKYGLQVDKKGEIFIGGLLNFNSQFTLGINPGDSVYTTNFMAPARLVLAAGLNWKPKPYFSFFFSPAAGKFTFVTDNGVDETKFGLEKGKDMRIEFGAYLKAEFNKEIFKNLNVKSTLTLFNNFLDNSMDTVFVNGIKETKSNRGNIDVDWLVGIDFVFSRWLTINVATQLVYDHDVKIPLTEKDGFTPILTPSGEQKTGPRTQFTESLSIGLTYRFIPKDIEKLKKKI